jgi:hypothetical protein
MPDEPLRTSVTIDPAIRAVEVKITARVEDEDLVLALLARTKEEPESRTVYFFDTPGLTLFDAGLVLRARKVRGDEDDSTVKLRPVDPATISEAWMANEAFEVEMDRVGDKEVISAKLSEPQDRGEIDEAVAGERPLRKLFSADQERLVAEFGPAEVGWDDLVVMGPIDVSKWKVEWDGFDREVVAERWLLPDGSDLVELSVKVEPDEVTSVSEEFLALLEGFGLEIEGDQQTKTRGALQFFTTGDGFD